MRRAPALAHQGSPLTPLGAPIAISVLPPLACLSPDAMNELDHASIKHEIRFLASEVGLPAEANKETRSSLLKDLRTLTRSIISASPTLTQTQRRALLVSAVDESVSEGDFQSSVLLMAAGSELSIRWPNAMIQSLIQEVGRQSQLFRYVFWMVVRRST